MQTKIISSADANLLSNRLTFLQNRKSKILKLKKSNRGTSLRETDNAISRIKKWLNL